VARPANCPGRAGAILSFIQLVIENWRQASTRRIIGTIGGLEIQCGQRRPPPGGRNEPQRDVSKLGVTKPSVRTYTRRSRSTRALNREMGNENKNGADGRQSIYSNVLLDHFRNPRNYGSLPSADVMCEEFNPLCGDRIRIELKINDNRIAAAHFVGDGCAISIAAASLLTELVLDADIDQGEVISGPTLLSSLQSDIKPSRMKCAMLPLEALRSCVRLYKQSQPNVIY
jgi:nitrogen fixation protein NifU and related proteins